MQTWNRYPYYLAASGREVALLMNFAAASLEYKRLLLPLAVQRCEACQSRLRAWKQETGTTFRLIR